MSGYLIHYASPYYDPVKAHEYYEEHKKLKGRTSTAGLNDAGKEAASYVKKQITAEKKTKIESKKTEKDNQIEQNKAQMQTQITSLKNQLAKMSTSQKKARRASINATIANLRAQNTAAREQLNEQFKTTKTQLGDEADAKYESELEKIKNTPKFKKTSSKKSSSSSGSFLI